MQSFYMASELEPGRSGLDLKTAANPEAVLDFQRVAWLEITGLPSVIPLTQAEFTSSQPPQIIHPGASGVFSPNPEYVNLTQVAQAALENTWRVRPMSKAQAGTALAVLGGLGLIGSALESLGGSGSSAAETQQVPESPSPASGQSGPGSRKWTRREFLRISALTAAGAAAAACSSGPAPSPKPPEPSRPPSPPTEPTPTVFVEQKLIDKNPGLAKLAVDTEPVASPSTQTEQEDVTLAFFKSLIDRLKYQFGENVNEFTLRLMETVSASDSKPGVYFEVESSPDSTKWVYSRWNNDGLQGHFVQMPLPLEKTIKNGATEIINVTDGIWEPVYRGAVGVQPVFFEPHAGMTIGYATDIPSDKLQGAKGFVDGQKNTSTSGETKIEGGIAVDLGKWAEAEKNYSVIIKYDDKNEIYYAIVGVATATTTDYYLVNKLDGKLVTSQFPKLENPNYYYQFDIDRSIVVIKDRQEQNVGDVDASGKPRFFGEPAVPIARGATSTPTPVAELKVTFTPTSIPLPTATATKPATLTPTLTPVPPTETPRLKIPERDPLLVWKGPVNLTLDTSSTYQWTTEQWTDLTNNGGASVQIINDPQIGSAYEYTVRELRKGEDPFRMYPIKIAKPQNQNPVDWEMRERMKFSEGYLPRSRAGGSGLSIMGNFYHVPAMGSPDKWIAMVGIDVSSTGVTLSVKDPATGGVWKNYVIQRRKFYENTLYDVRLYTYHGQYQLAVNDEVWGSWDMHPDTIGKSPVMFHSGAYGYGVPVGSKLINGPLEVSLFSK